VKNASFYAEVEHAFTSLPSSRLSVGGNAPVMVQRFVTEGVQQVTLAANMSPQLRSQLHSSVRGLASHLSLPDRLVARLFQMRFVYSPQLAIDSVRWSGEHCNFSPTVVG